jgi:S-adenosylmethionine:tRNA ribosyltransferase-isomerase
MVLLPGGGIEHTEFSNLSAYLASGDVLVLNDTRVFPARLLGHRVPSGGAVECLLLDQIPNRESPTTNHQPPTTNQHWSALVHPGQKLKPGALMVFERAGVRIDAEVVGMHFHGRRTVRLSTDHAGGLAEAVEIVGHVPLPPYIKRADSAVDRERYQTVYARERGSIAAPTAGLHFTPEQLASLDARGVQRLYLTLHVSYGTFKPVTADLVEDHVVDAERFNVPVATCVALTRAVREGRRIIAVGTTSVRALESLHVASDGTVTADRGETSLFVRPGHRFMLVRGLVTNFHLPKSSLLMLVSAFAGRERVLAAYREAVERQYRFYSYGDAMLVL